MNIKKAVLFVIILMPSQFYSASIKFINNTQVDLEGWIAVPGDIKKFTISGRKKPGDLGRLTDLGNFGRGSYKFTIQPKYTDQYLGKYNYIKNVDAGTTAHFPEDFMPLEEGSKFLYPGEEWMYGCKISVPEGYYDPIPSNILTFKQITNNIGQTLVYDNKCQGLNFTIPADPTVIYPTYQKKDNYVSTDELEIGTWGKAEDLTLKKLADWKSNGTCVAPDTTKTYNVTFNSTSGYYTLIFQVYPSPVAPKVIITLRNIITNSYTDFSTELDLSLIKKAIEERIKSYADQLTKTFPILLKNKENTQDIVTKSIGAPFIWLTLTLNPTEVTVDNLWVQFRTPASMSAGTCQLIDGTGSRDWIRIPSSTSKIQLSDIVKKLEPITKTTSGSASQ